MVHKDRIMRLSSLKVRLLSDYGEHSISVCTIRGTKMGCIAPASFTHTHTPRHPAAARTARKWVALRLRVLHTRTRRGTQLLLERQVKTNRAFISWGAGKGTSRHSATRRRAGPPPCLRLVPRTRAR